MILSTLVKISNPTEVQRNFQRYRGKDNAKLYVSERHDKKYKVLRPDGKVVHFGSRMPDYTKHRDEVRRKAYLVRSAGVKGDWRDDKYSAANLARELLW
jgi:predicted methyltransferase